MQETCNSRRLPSDSHKSATARLSDLANWHNDLRTAPPFHGKDYPSRNFDQIMSMAAMAVRVSIVN
jgi:hypothetical protein